MICLTDHDILIHLAAWNLLDEFQALLVELFGTQAADICILGYFVDQLENFPDRLEAQYGKSAIDRLRTFCKHVNSAYDLPYHKDALATFSKVQDIDDGEATLVAVALLQDHSLVLTNDIRFIDALGAGRGDIAIYREAMQGRIVHLRQIILALLERKGHRFLKDRIRNQHRSDTLIITAFEQTAGKCKLDLKTSIETLRRQGNGLLITIPEYYDFS